MSNFKIFIGDGKYYFASKFLQGIFFLVNLKIFTYFLPPIKYGEYSVVLIILTTFILISNTWLSASILRLSSKNKHSVLFQSSLNYIFTFSVFLSIFLLVFLLVLININFSLNIDLAKILIYIFYYLSSTFFIYFQTFFRAERRTKVFTFSTIVQALFSIFFTVFLLSTKIDQITAIFLGLSLANLFGIIYLLSFKKFVFSVTENDKGLIGRILQYGIPVIFIQLFVCLTMFSDQLVLKYFGFSKELGAYAANYTLIDKSINILSSIVISTFQPIMFQMWERKSKKESYKFFNKILTLLLILSFLLSISLYFFYDLVVNLLFTSEYSMPDLFLYILAGSILLSFGNFYSEILNVFEKTKMIALIYSVSFIVGFSANIIFVPEYGIKATAMINILSYSVLFLGMFIMSKFYLKKEWEKRF